MLVTLILQTTKIAGNKILNTKNNKNKKNQDAPDSVGVIVVLVLVKVFKTYQLLQNWLSSKYLIWLKNQFYKMIL